MEGPKQEQDSATMMAQTYLMIPSALETTLNQSPVTQRSVLILQEVNNIPQHCSRLGNIVQALLTAATTQ